MIDNDSGVEGAPWRAPEQHDATCHDMSCLMNFYDFLQALFFFGAPRPDVCYTWWTLAAAQLAESLVDSRLSDIFDLNALQKFVHLCMADQGPGLKLTRWGPDVSDSVRCLPEIFGSHNDWFWRESLGVKGLVSGGIGPHPEDDPDTSQMAAGRGWTGMGEILVEVMTRYRML